MSGSFEKGYAVPVCDASNVERRSDVDYPKNIN
jgi:hypothetical protein